MCNCVARRMQYTAKSNAVKFENFRLKKEKKDFAQNIDCGYTLEPQGEAVLTPTHNLSFDSKIRKNVYPLVSPGFTIEKWGSRGIHLSRPMGKPTICIGEHKGADQLRGNREADQRLCFATRIVQFLFYLTPKFQASSLLLLLYRSVCVGPGRKPHCWFSHEAAHFTNTFSW